MQNEARLSTVVHVGRLKEQDTDVAREQWNNQRVDGLMEIIQRPAFGNYFTCSVPFGRLTVGTARKLS